MAYHSSRGGSGGDSYTVHHANGDSETVHPSGHRERHSTMGSSISRGGPSWQTGYSRSSDDDDDSDYGYSRRDVKSSSLPYPYTVERTELGERIIYGGGVEEMVYSFSKLRSYIIKKIQAGEEDQIKDLMEKLLSCKEKEPVFTYQSLIEIARYAKGTHSSDVLADVAIEAEEYILMNYFVYYSAIDSFSVESRKKLANAVVNSNDLEYMTNYILYAKDIDVDKLVDDFINHFKDGVCRGMKSYLLAKYELAIRIASKIVSDNPKAFEKLTSFINETRAENEEAEQEFQAALKRRKEAAEEHSELPRVPTF